MTSACYGRTQYPLVLSCSSHFLSTLVTSCPIFVFFSFIGYCPITELYRFCFLQSRKLVAISFILKSRPSHPACPIWCFFPASSSLLQPNCCSDLWEYPHPTSLLSPANTLVISCADKQVNFQVWLCWILTLLPDT